MRPVATAWQKTALLTRWQVIETLGQCLGRSVTGAPPPAAIRDPRFPWPLFIECASSHLVTPVLAAALDGVEGLPPELPPYLDGVLALNRARNEKLSRALRSVVGELNRIGVRPVLLKGAVALWTDLYPDPAMRMLRDIDLLVPEDRLIEAARVAEALGYHPNTYGSGPMDIVPSEMHHYPKQVDRSGVAVEIHRRVTGPDWAGILPSGEFFERARPDRAHGLDVLLPDWTDHALHTIVHSELADGAYQVARANLRSLLELAILQRRQELGVSWAGIAQSLHRAGVDDLGVTLASLTDALFGLPPPPGFPAADPRKIDRYRRSIDSRGRLLAGILVARHAERLRRLRRHPWRVLSLVNPGFYRNLAETLRGLRAYRW
jgi:hypothetical protein